MNRAVLVALLALNATQALAQATATVRGTVTDAVTGRPVVGAIVRLGLSGLERTTRTDETGAFVIANMPLGALPLDVRRIGYDVVRRTLDVTTTITPLAITLRRIATLDTVQVRAAKQGLFGVVGTSGDLRPLPNAKLTLVGVGTKRVVLDSTAHFFIPINVIGTYVLRATAPGYDGQTVSVMVAPNEGVEVALLLDSAMNGVSHKLDMPFADFEQRVKTRGQLAAMIPRTELLKDAKAGLTDALLFARSYAKANMRLGSGACVFVDGYPRPNLGLNSIQADEVEAVEVYGKNPRHSDRTGSLANKWYGPCGTTGRPNVYPGDDVVYWVVVWLKH